MLEICEVSVGIFLALLNNLGLVYFNFSLEGVKGSLLLNGDAGSLTLISERILYRVGDNPKGKYYGFILNKLFSRGFIYEGF